ncbi:hypothetical protein RhiJN_12162 [Ceratobasidium sp. AG-Ba]|nr:hypothetical protein RhiJN_12162 [Ceratobasidium sp. AG-Ba]
MASDPVQSCPYGSDTDTSPTSSQLIFNTLEKFKGSFAVATEGKPSSYSEYLVHSWASRPVPNPCLDSDVLLKIVEQLEYPGDKLSLLLTSRWHYAALGCALYRRINLYVKCKIDLLVRTLLGDDVRSNAILYLDVMFPPGHRFDRHFGGDITKEFYYARRRTLVEGTFLVLKLAPRLKCLNISNFGRDSYMPWSTIAFWLQDPYSFGLRHLSLPAVDGTLKFLEQQTGLIELDLLPDTEHTTFPQLSTSMLKLPQLRKLWAAPQWCSFIVPRSPLEYLGLLEDASSEDRLAWENCVYNLAETGGHETLKSLTLTYESVFGDNSFIDLLDYKHAFPQVTRLSLILPGFKCDRFENTEKSWQHAEHLAQRYAEPLWSSVKELIFLRPGDDWPNPHIRPYSVQRAGRDCTPALLNTLEVLFPDLGHVDLTEKCYRKTGVGKVWYCSLRICQY